MLKDQQQTTLHQLPDQDAKPEDRLDIKIALPFRHRLSAPNPDEVIIHYNFIDDILQNYLPAALPLTTNFFNRKCPKVRFKIAAWNVRGLKDSSHLHVSALFKRGVMLCALQETKITQDIIKVAIGTIYTFQHEIDHHGLDGVLCPPIPYRHRVCPIIQVSDRIVVLQIRTNPTNDP